MCVSVINLKGASLGPKQACIRMVLCGNSFSFIVDGMSSVFYISSNERGHSLFVTLSRCRDFFLLVILVVR